MNKVHLLTRWQAKAYEPSRTHRRHSLWALSSGDTNAHELVSLCVQQLVSTNVKKRNHKDTSHEKTNLLSIINDSDFQTNLCSK